MSKTQTDLITCPTCGGNKCFAGWICCGEFAENGGWCCGNELSKVVDCGHCKGTGLIHALPKEIDITIDSDETGF